MARFSARFLLVAAALALFALSAPAVLADSGENSKPPPPKAGASPPPPKEGGDSPPSPSEGGDSPPSPKEGGDSPPSPSEDGSGDKSGSSSPPSPSGDKGKGEGDPHFTGADASHFDFSGVPNKTYCLISDSHLHMNAYFGGYYGEYEGNAHKALNWIRKVGFLFGHHSMLFEARQGASWQYENGYMARIEVDGEEVVIAKPGDKAVLADGSVTIAWVAAREMSGDDEIDVYSVSIAGVAKLLLRLRPEIANFRTETDGTVHFDFEFVESQLSDNAHGVLGQTYRPDHANRLSTQKLVYSKLLNAMVIPTENGEGFLDGNERDYRSSAMLAADCKVARFARVEKLDRETARAIEVSSIATKSTGISGLPRKMLKLVGAV